MIVDLGYFVEYNIDDFSRMGLREVSLLLSVILSCLIVLLFLACLVWKIIQSYRRRKLLKVL
jgi:hypothetical protein